MPGNEEWFLSILYFLLSGPSFVSAIAAPDVALGQCTEGISEVLSKRGQESVVPSICPATDEVPWSQPSLIDYPVCGLCIAAWFIALVYPFDLVTSPKLSLGLTLCASNFYIGFRESEDMSKLGAMIEVIFFIINTLIMGIIWKHFAANEGKLPQRSRSSDQSHDWLEKYWLDAKLREVIEHALILYDGGLNDEERGGLLKKFKKIFDELLYKAYTDQDDLALMLDNKKGASRMSQVCSQQSQSLEWELLVGICVLGFAGFLDATIKSGVLPSMQTDLGMSLSQLQWVVNAFFLGIGAFMSSMGWVADLYGRRKAFFIGTWVFAATSVVAGLAPNSYISIACHLLRGFSVTSTIPVVIAIIQSTHDKRHIAKAMRIERLTFEEMMNRFIQLSVHLRKKGLGKEGRNRVQLQSTKSPGFIIALLVIAYAECTRKAFFMRKDESSNFHIFPEMAVQPDWLRKFGVQARYDKIVSESDHVRKLIVALHVLGRWGEYAKSEEVSYHKKVIFRDAAKKDAVKEAKERQQRRDEEEAMGRLNERKEQDRLKKIAEEEAKNRKSKEAKKRQQEADEEVKRQNAIEVKTTRVLEEIKGFIRSGLIDRADHESKIQSFVLASGDHLVKVVNDVSDKQKLKEAAASLIRMLYYISCCDNAKATKLASLLVDVLEEVKLGETREYREILSSLSLYRQYFLDDSQVGEKEIVKVGLEDEFKNIETHIPKAIENIKKIDARGKEEEPHENLGSAGEVFATFAVQLLKGYGIQSFKSNKALLGGAGQRDGYGSVVCSGACKDETDSGAPQDGGVGSTTRNLVAVDESCLHPTLKEQESKEEEGIEKVQGERQKDLIEIIKEMSASEGDNIDALIKQFNQELSLYTGSDRKILSKDFETAAEKARDKESVEVYFKMPVESGSSGDSCHSPKKDMISIVFSRLNERSRHHLSGAFLNYKDIGIGEYCRVVAECGFERYDPESEDFNRPGAGYDDHGHRSQTLYKHGFFAGLIPELRDLLYRYISQDHFTREMYVNKFNQVWCIWVNDTESLLVIKANICKVAVCVEEVLDSCSGNEFKQYVVFLFIKMIHDIYKKNRRDALRKKPSKMQIFLAPLYKDKNRKYRNLLSKVLLSGHREKPIPFKDEEKDVWIRKVKSIIKDIKGYMTVVPSAPISPAALYGGDAASAVAAASATVDASDTAHSGTALSASAAPYEPGRLM